jgi:hypothetical protein
MTRFRLTGWCVVLVALSVIGCRSDAGTWRDHLAASNAARLVGLWAMRLRVDAVGADTLARRQVDGSIALTLNEEGGVGPGSGRPPEFFGTYDIDFDRLGFRAGVTGGVPALVARMRGDSIELILAPESSLPVECRGIVRGDSIAGRWTTHQRSGLDRAGDFLLYRR